MRLAIYLETISEYISEGTTRAMGLKYKRGTSAPLVILLLMLRTKCREGKKKFEKKSENLILDFLEEDQGTYK